MKIYPTSNGDLFCLEVDDKLWYGTMYVPSTPESDDKYHFRWSWHPVNLPEEKE